MKKHNFAGFFKFHMGLRISYGKNYNMNTVSITYPYKSVGNVLIMWVTINSTIRSKNKELKTSHENLSFYSNRGEKMSALNLLVSLKLLKNVNNKLDVTLVI